jgi:hypothetical protein
MEGAAMKYMSRTIPSFLMSAVLLPAAGAAVPPDDFHVAPTGDDVNPGTSAKPFATPAKAVAAVRARIAGGLRKDIRVVFRAGTYELDAPLVFTPKDSGTARHAITYAAWPGETVVLSGGRRIAGWKKGAGGRWAVSLPGVRAGTWFFRQLVVDDRRVPRARWPEEDGQLHIASVGDGVRAFTFDKPLPEGDLGGQDAELVVYENWSVSRALVVSSDARSLKTTTPVGWIGHGWTTASRGKAVFIEHARAHLDRPGEWFLDRKAGMLTYLPRDGETPEKTSVVAPVLQQVIRIEGVKGSPVRNLVFDGLRFEHTHFPLPPFGYSEIQAAHYGTETKQPTHVQPVGVECVYAEGVRFERCRFAHLGASGIGFGPGCRKNCIVGCRIEDIGGNGVMIGWRGKGRLQAGREGRLDADWNDPEDAPAGNEVVHCRIRRCGADSTGSVGIFAAFSADTRIAHNHVHEMPYTGVSIGYRWNTSPTTQARCLVERNHIHDVMRKLADGGGIYSLGFQPGTVLRWNHIHDVHRSRYAHGGAPNNGFFVDEGSKGYLFEGNVVYGTSGGAVRFNQNKREWHTWKDNHFNIAVPRRAKGRAGNALDATGGGSFLEVPHDTALEPASLTLEAWIFPSAPPGGQDPRRWIVNKNGNEWQEGHYALVAHGRKAGAYLNIGGGQGNMIELAGDGDVLETRRWHHLAMTYDGATLKIYCDGAPAGTKPVNRKRRPASGPLAIGRRVDGYGPSQFRGLIDEVRVYNRALSASEVATRAKASGAGAAPGCVRQWSFDEDARMPAAVKTIVGKAGPGEAYRAFLKAD